MLTHLKLAEGMWKMAQHNHACALAEIERCKAELQRQGAERQRLQADLQHSKHLTCQAEANRDWTGKEEADLEQHVLAYLLQHRDKLMLYGARAINEYLPPFLRLSTVDFDLFLRQHSRKQLERLCDGAVEFLRERFPDRLVWQRSALHNPDGSRSVLVSQKHILDFTLPPPALVNLQLPVTPQLSSVPLKWLFGNLQALIVNANARFLWSKSADRLLRLCWADQWSLLPEPLDAKDVTAVLSRLGPHGAELLESQRRRAELVARAQEIDRIKEKLEEVGNGKLHARLAQSEREKDRLAKDLIQAEDKVESCETQLQAQEQRIKELQTALQQSERQCKSLQQSNSTLSNRANRLQTDLDQKNRVAQRSEARCTDLLIQVENLQGENHRLLQDNERLCNDTSLDTVLELRKEISTLTAKDKISQELLQTIRGQLKNYKTEDQVRGQELITTQRKLERCREEIKRAEQHHLEFHGRYIKLRRALENTLQSRGFPLRLLDAEDKQVEESASKWIFHGVPFRNRTVDLTVWLCPSCASDKPPMALQLEFGSKTLGLPLRSAKRARLAKGDDSVYVCNTCLYDNLVQLLDQCE